MKCAPVLSNGIGRNSRAGTSGLIERIFPELYAKRQEYLEQLDDSEESDDEDILGEIEQLKRKGKWFEKEEVKRATKPPPPDDLLDVYRSKTPWEHTNFDEESYSRRAKTSSRQG
ncbi:Oidioi.mRNA.OKI2018_I69.chr1.g1724.t1.cds [Oikopleura dioica]|uniref:Oidioi.mRNA.OKI2018_I69.chr1.g1724.t1.cds n=1 Tax=Oikopleura dioica TaxID=34765 RepID=A0ABN7SNT7_OIKDI|nr:Oidioi.mRNA.OKI2018_I69.chr1.g1724.t1.cds [Oikopleura dioica]